MDDRERARRARGIGGLILLLLAGVGGGQAGVVAAAAGPPAAPPAAARIGGIGPMALDAAGNGWAWAYPQQDNYDISYLLRIENGAWRIAADTTTDPTLLPPGLYLTEMALTPSGADGWAIGAVQGDEGSAPLFLRYRDGAWSVRKTSFTPAIDLLDVAVTPDGLDGWMTAWDSDRGVYRLLRYQKGSWDYVAGPEDGALVSVALSPDGKSGWAVGPGAADDNVYAPHAAYRLVGGRWQRVAGELYNSAFYPTNLVADNAGNGWVLATFAPDLAALTRRAPVRQPAELRDVLYRLTPTAAPRLVPVDLPPPAENPDATLSLSSLSVDGAGRGWLSGIFNLGASPDPLREVYVVRPLLFRVAGDTVMPVPLPAVGLAADLNVNLLPVTVSPDGAHTWVGVYNNDDTGDLRELPEPWAHPAPAAAPPLPGAGQCFAAVPYCLRGAFARYWQTHGGLDQFGYPITPEVLETQGDKTYTVQYTQRARLEYHPEYAGTANEVLLGLLGNTLADPRAAEPPFTRVAGGPAGSTYFPETGHTLGAPFLGYWQSKGGLPVFGLPRSEAFDERNRADGKTYRVQYFERNRIEYHPENAGTPFEYLLGLLGVEQFAATYGYTP